MKRLNILGNVFSIILAAIVTVAACFFTDKVQIYNPAIIMAIVMVFFTAVIGRIAGAVSLVYSILYFLYFYSENYRLGYYTPPGIEQCIVVITSMLILYVMVMIICDKRDDARRRLENVNEALAERVKNQKEILNVLRRESDYDALTDIYNRRGGDKKINSIIDARRQDGTIKHFKVLLATMDIDDFKSINDHYGHFAGDEALQHFAISLCSTFPVNSVPIRAGGDEFNLFLYGSNISEIEAKLLDFAKGTFRFEYDDQPIAFHISCGYAIYPTHANSAKEMYRKADDTLYYVKMTGKHRAMRYSDDIDDGPRTSMSFMTRRISENLPIAYMVYRADASEEILAVSKTLFAMCECDSLHDFMTHTGGTFRGFVHPDDIDNAEKSIHDQIATNRHSLDAVDYRIITKTGRTVKVHDIGRLVNDETMGDLFYVVIYSEEISKMAENAADTSLEKDKEAMVEHLPERQALIRC